MYRQMIYYHSIQSIDGIDFGIQIRVMKVLTCQYHKSRRSNTYHNQYQFHQHKDLDDHLNMMMRHMYSDPLLLWYYNTHCYIPHQVYRLHRQNNLSIHPPTHHVMPGIISNVERYGQVLCRTNASASCTVITVTISIDIAIHTTTYIQTKSCIIRFCV
jgi:hypothetical protein